MLKKLIVRIIKKIFLIEFINDFIINNIYTIVQLSSIITRVPSFCSKLFDKFIFLSSRKLRICLLLCVTATLHTVEVCPLKIYSCLFSKRLQTRIVLSLEPEIIYLLSKVIAMLVTEEV